MEHSLYPPRKSPFERVLSHFPFVDGLLAQLTTVELLRLTNVSQTARTQIYGHTPSFRVFNFVRFCQEGDHRALPNLWPHNATNKLRDWEYDSSVKKYPYIDVNEWECNCKACRYYSHLEYCRGDPLLGQARLRTEYYYRGLNSTKLLSTLRRLPDSMPLTILILDGTDVDMCFVEECFKTTWGGAWLKELSLRKCAKIEHFDLLEWLGPAFYRNVIHGLRVLKLWGCGTLSPKGAFKPSLATGNSSGNQVNADAVNLPQNDLSGSSPDAQTPINTEAAAAPPSSGRANHATLSLTSLCRRMKINLDIGLCTMKQQCVSLQAIERAYAAQDILDAIGGVMGIPPHVRDNQLADLVVLAEKKPIKRKCCVTGCNVVIVKALCMSCEENMTCQKCQNFYCQHHASSEYLDLLCPICGPCCKNCFPTYSTECSECDQHFCNEHYPNGRCLIELDTVTGDLLLIDESEVIAEEKMVEDGQIEYQDLFPGRGRKRYEKCKDCGVITCRECIDEAGWQYSICKTVFGLGCGGIICEECSNHCGFCGAVGCESCMTVDPRGDFYFDDVWPCRGCAIPPEVAQEEARQLIGDCGVPGLVDTDKDNFSNVDRTIDSDKEDLEDPDMVPELVDPDQDGY